MFQDSRILSLNEVFLEVITSQMDEELLLVDAGGAEALEAQSFRGSLVLRLKTTGL